MRVNAPSDRRILGISLHFDVQLKCEGRRENNRKIQPVFALMDAQRAFEPGKGPGLGKVDLSLHRLCIEQATLHTERHRHRTGCKVNATGIFNRHPGQRSGNIEDTGFNRV